MKPLNPVHLPNCQLRTKWKNSTRMRKCLNFTEHYCKLFMGVEEKIVVCIYSQYSFDEIFVRWNILGCCFFCVCVFVFSLNQIMKRFSVLWCLTSSIWRMQCCNRVEFYGYHAVHDHTLPPGHITGNLIALWLFGSSANVFFRFLICS